MIYVKYILVVVLFGKIVKWYRIINKENFKWTFEGSCFPRGHSKACSLVHSVSSRVISSVLTNRLRDCPWPQRRLFTIALKISAYYRLLRWLFTVNYILVYGFLEEGRCRFAEGFVFFSLSDATCA